MSSYGDPWTLLAARMRQQQATNERERDVWPLAAERAGQISAQLLAERKQTAGEQGRLAQALGQTAPTYSSGALEDAARIGAGRQQEQVQQAIAARALAEQKAKWERDQARALETLKGNLDIDRAAITAQGGETTAGIHTKSREAIAKANQRNEMNMLKLRLKHREEHPELYPPGSKSEADLGMGVLRVLGGMYGAEAGSLYPERSERTLDMMLELLRSNPQLATPDLLNRLELLPKPSLY